MLRPIQIKKRGVSAIIGYILLISITMAISIFVYMWIKTYVPRDLQNCPDGTSISIKEIFCLVSGENYTLNLTLENNGRFNIAGYFILATNSSSQELATLDISPKLSDLSGTLLGNAILFATGDTNSMEPNDEKKAIFNLDSPIYSVEVTPIRFQTEESKKKFVNCGQSKIKEVVNCEIRCTSNCDERVCGPSPNGCGGENECGLCTGENVCTGIGTCVPPEECTDTCSSLAYECGIQTICGASVNCSEIIGCDIGKVCNAESQCEIACGNGEINPGEECDDGDIVGGDGCSSVCTTETGWECAGEPSTCSICNSNLVCDASENCLCSDCENKMNGCAEGWRCQSGSCVEGIAVGSCKQYCSYLGYNDILSHCALNCGGDCSGTCETGGDEYCSSPTTYCCCVP